MSYKVILDDASLFLNGEIELKQTILLWELSFVFQLFEWFLYRQKTMIFDEYFFIERKITVKFYSFQWLLRKSWDIIEVYHRFSVISNRSAFLELGTKVFGHFIQMFIEIFDCLIFLDKCLCSFGTYARYSRNIIRTIPY